MDSTNTSEENDRLLPENDLEQGKTISVFFMILIIMP